MLAPAMRPEKYFLDRWLWFTAKKPELKIEKEKNWKVYVMIFWYIEYQTENHANCECIDSFPL